MASRRERRVLSFHRFRPDIYISRYIGLFILPGIPNLFVYVAGLLGFTCVFSLYYYKNLEEQKTSILLYLLGLLVYSLGPLSIRYTLWMPALLFVLTVFILNARKLILDISTSINARELETLKKIILLSAVILPLLPDRNVIPLVPLSPFKIWLAVVVVSGISYGGYIAQTYFLATGSMFSPAWWEGCIPAQR